MDVLCNPEPSAVSELAEPCSIIAPAAGPLAEHPELVPDAIALAGIDTLIGKGMQSERLRIPHGCCWCSWWYVVWPGHIAAFGAKGTTDIPRYDEMETRDAETQTEGLGEQLWEHIKVPQACGAACCAQLLQRIHIHSVPCGYYDQQ